MSFHILISHWYFFSGERFSIMYEISGEVILRVHYFPDTKLDDFTYVVCLILKGPNG